MPPSAPSSWSTVPPACRRSDAPRGHKYTPAARPRIARPAYRPIRRIDDRREVGVATGRLAEADRPRRARLGLQSFLLSDVIIWRFPSCPRRCLRRCRTGHGPSIHAWRAARGMPSPRKRPACPHRDAIRPACRTSSAMRHRPPAPWRRTPRRRNAARPRKRCACAYPG